jgi:hypothetical protein
MRPHHWLTSFLPDYSNLGCAWETRTTQHTRRDYKLSLLCSKRWCRDDCLLFCV